MYFLIETSGRTPHTDVSDHIKDYLEDTYGATVETSVGMMDSPVTIYNGEGDTIAAFNDKPDDAVLNFYFGDFD
jgi:hypothetical protein|tara:strand:+ start:479 stop:700 length:222 start_codon:yes stop_codon:yes gene_type:complete